MAGIGPDSSGRLQLPAALAGELGSGPLRPVSHSSGHLLLVGEEGVHLAGLLGELGVADLLSFFNMFRKTGILAFQLEEGRKDLFFKQGEIVHASTTLPDEELGEVLYGLGKLDRETLQRVRRGTGEGTGLGQALLREKLISSQDLWHALRHQVETVVYNLFAAREGSFFFLSWQPDEEKTVRLSMSTQNLIMEGLRRLDERALFLRKVPSLDAFPVAVGETPEGLNAAEKRLVELIRSGRYNVRELIRLGGMGEFEGLRMVYQLAEKRAVRFEEAPPVQDLQGALGEILSIYNGALTVLFRQVSAAKPDFRKELKVFLRDLPQPFSYVLRDAELAEDGGIQGERILGNLAGLEEGDKKKLLADSLHELVYMECMAARRELGETESAPLIGRIQEISRRVQNLVEKR